MFVSAEDGATVDLLIDEEKDDDSSVACDDNIGGVRKASHTASKYKLMMQSIREEKTGNRMVVKVILFCDRLEGTWRVAGRAIARQTDQKDNNWRRLRIHPKHRRRVSTALRFDTSLTLEQKRSTTWMQTSLSILDL